MLQPLLLYGIALAVFCAAAVIYGLCLKNAKSSLKATCRKAFALFAMLMFVLAWYLGRTAIENTVGLNIRSPFGENVFATLLTVIMLWLTAAVSLLSAMYAFYPYPNVRNILKYIGTPLMLVNILALPWHATAICGENDGGLLTVRVICLAVCYGSVLVLTLSAWLDAPKFRIKRKSIFSMLGWFVSALLVSVPAYLPKAVFGWAKASIQIIDLKPAHRLLMYGCLLLTVFIYLLLRKHPQRVIHFALVFVSLATLMSFSLDYTLDRYLTDKWMLQLPFHLCNTAMYLIPLCLIFRMKRLYNFTFFVNVIGAFFALSMPNYAADKNLFDTGITVFWINHYCACFMPILMMALGEFKRPKLKQFIYAIVAFAGYYITVLVMNAWFSNYGDADFFFINSDFITSKLGAWAERTRDLKAVLPIAGLNLTFYPVYQSLFFVAYILFTVAMWFLYEQCFSIADAFGDMAKRQEKIKLDRLALASQLNGRSEEEPVDMESTNSLVLNNVVKRYGKSDVYAVHEANLTVNGGEVFGFLGPNGAGKSTIIKGIVGIQPITSGTITVCGYDVKTQSVMAKRQIGFVPDHYELYENLTGREYINYIADLYRVSKADRDARIDEYVTLFMLKGAFDNPMKTYSHGMKQKIAIMAALVHNPRVWILDEPLTGLDPDSIFQVKECMKRHAAAGNIVFFSSHIIDVVERICDRIAIIRRGQILCTRSLKDLEASGESLEQFYMGTIGDNATANAIAVHSVKAVNGEQ